MFLEQGLSNKLLNTENRLPLTKKGNEERSIYSLMSLIYSVSQYFLVPYLATTKEGVNTSSKLRLMCNASNTILMSKFWGVRLSLMLSPK